MDTLGQKLRAHWVAAGVSVRPGVTSVEVEAFEARHNVRLSGDLRGYFCAVDGMVEGEMDGHLFSFWPLNTVRSVAEEFSKYGGGEHVDDLASYFVFADYFLWSHAYAVRLSPNGLGGECIIRIGPDVSPFPEAAASFSEFVDRYLANPYDLLVTG